jgi:hypothetical protein
MLCVWSQAIASSAWIMGTAFFTALFVQIERWEC